MHKSRIKIKVKNNIIIYENLHSMKNLKINNLL